VYANAINVRTLVIAAAVAMLLALGGAGIAYANNNGGLSEEQVTGPEAQKAKSAAIAAVGGGSVTEVERDEANGSGAFEVEVAREDGSSQVEVHLDGDYNVVGRQADEDGPNDNDGANED